MAIHRCIVLSGTRFSAAIGIGREHRMDSFGDDAEASIGHVLPFAFGIGGLFEELSVIQKSGVKIDRG